MEVVNTATLEQYELPPYPQEYEIGNALLHSDHSCIITSGAQEHEFELDELEYSHHVHMFDFQTLQWTEILAQQQYYTGFPDRLYLYGGYLYNIRKNLGSIINEMELECIDPNVTEKPSVSRLKLPKSYPSCKSFFFVI